jgi:hypothetical protein
MARPLISFLTESIKQTLKISSNARLICFSALTVSVLAQGCKTASGLSGADGGTADSTLTDAESRPLRVALEPSQLSAADWPEVTQIQISKEAQSSWVDDILKGSSRSVSPTNNDIQKAYRHCTGVWIAPNVLLTVRECFASEVTPELLKQSLVISGVSSPVEHAMITEKFVLLGYSANVNQPWLRLAVEPFLDLKEDQLVGIGFGISTMTQANEWYYVLDTNQISFQSFSVNDSAVYSRSEINFTFGTVPINANRGSIVVDSKNRQALALFMSLYSPGRVHSGAKFFADLSSTEFQKALTEFETKSNIRIPRNLESMRTFDAKSDDLTMKVILKSRSEGLELILLNRSGHLLSDQLKRINKSEFSGKKDPWIKLKFETTSRMPVRGDKISVSVTRTDGPTSFLNGRTFIVQ